MPQPSLQSSLQHAITDQDIESCFDVMQELRPHIQQKTFLPTIRHMEKEGYKLVFINHNKKVVAVAGYRISTNLFIGKNLYVDDLVTTCGHRSKGYGEHLINWLRGEAIKAKCNVYHLDSSTHRDQAHKFYFKQEFIIASYHFSQSLVTNVVVGNTIRI
jgi:hypothetical protein